MKLFYIYSTNVPPPICTNGVRHVFRPSDWLLRHMPITAPCRKF